jgi:hypothetical protein
MSTAALIDLAKRTVHGPHSWSKSERQKPFAAHRVILNPPIDRVSSFSKPEDQVKLLSGGRFVLFYAGGALKCWSVAEDKFLWEFRGTLERPLVHVLAMEVVDDGQAVAIVAAFVRNVDTQRW